MNALSGVILEVFHVNGLLMAWGDEITRPFGLSSSRWHVLGALRDGPLTLAQIGRRMGLTRQSVRRTALLLERKGLVAFRDNPGHKRARLAELTREGCDRLGQIMAVYRERAAGLIESLAAGLAEEGLDAPDPDAAARLLAALGRGLVGQMTEAVGAEGADEVDDVGGGADEPD